jgi:hypothetical protein
MSSSLIFRRPAGQLSAIQPRGAKCEADADLEAVRRDELAGDANDRIDRSWRSKFLQIFFWRDWGISTAWT